MENYEKAEKLFRYILELEKLNNKEIPNLKELGWHQFIEEIPKDNENIKLENRNTIEGKEYDLRGEILSVKKPSFTKIPSIEKEYVEWLEEGWDNYKKDLIIRDKISVLSKEIDEEKNNKDLKIFGEGGEVLELEEKFLDDFPEIKSKINEWAKKRNIWAEEQKKIEKTRTFFSKLSEIRVMLENNSEEKELILGTGIIKCGNLEQACLLKKVKINFDAKENIIKICDMEVDSTSYCIFLSDVVNELRFDKMSLKQFDDEVREKSIHPLDYNEVPDILKTFIHRLSSKSEYLENYNDKKVDETLITISNSPVLFVRKKPNNSIKILEEIISYIGETKKIPNHILDIVSPNENADIVEYEEESFTDRLAKSCGESNKIFLVKEANREQLEIAEKIERENAVLVQGPPGTGKTHTISNLLCHFLAQGKNVLVTSHTKKALRVLKDKIPSSIQSLCVSIIDDDNKDMEKSIDGITDYIGSNSIEEIKKDILNIEKEREDILKKAKKNREKIYLLKNKEFSPITYLGESYRIDEVAKFVRENENRLNYIPGYIELDKAMPVLKEDIEYLYNTKSSISLEEIKELESDLPDPSYLMSYVTFKDKVELYNKEKENIKLNLENMKSFFEDTSSSYKEEILFVDNKKIIDTTKICYEKISNLSLYLENYKNIEEWMLEAACANLNSGDRKIWEELVKRIKNYISFEIGVKSVLFGKEIEFIEQNIDILKKSINELKGAIEHPKKMIFFDVLSKKQEEVLKKVKYNGSKINTIEECEEVIAKIKLEEKQRLYLKYWDKLIKIDSYEIFDDTILESYLHVIEKFLYWTDREERKFDDLLEEAGINSKLFVSEEVLVSKKENLRNKITAIRDIVPYILKICYSLLEIREINLELTREIKKYKEEQVLKSTICRELVDSIKEKNIENYKNNQDLLFNTFNKYAIKNKREELLKKIKEVAPDWERLLEKLGEEDSFPTDVLEAWKWKQLNGKLNELSKEPLEEIQKNLLKIGEQLKESTERLVEKKSWYELLVRVNKNRSLQSDLTQWKQINKKIGKGTGKNAFRQRKEARELMVKCQAAVPTWIMPMKKAMESFTVGKSSFDIVIVDEASQSSLSSLAIMFMGKKIIIVGDDKQVSPDGIGKEIEKSNFLKDTYLKGVISGIEAYDEKTSLYDIALSKFNPLMLKEHFRCVPEIIGYSNRLSYDNRIKPLRDASSSNLFPAVISYKVKGERSSKDKTNEIEARTIVCLIKACIQEKLYEGKSFGVISLLGNKQSELINRYLLDKIDAVDYAERKILCGDSAQFQGDERDVVFLSMVDSGNEEGPLSLRREGGSGDKYKKRYNVAASRAKDQMWIIHSLDKSRDLKQEDLRKGLLEYAENPRAFINQVEEIEKKSESPFEEAVAKSLVAKGYNLVQQWEAGSYRIDMVVIYKGKKIAIECDGERYHSGEEAIKNDMERQTILERIGWKFIRIRGSRFFRNPDKTMLEIYDELSQKGIYPEDSISEEDKNKIETEILEKIKHRAQILLEHWDKPEDDILVDKELIDDTLDEEDIVGESLENSVIDEVKIEEIKVDKHVEENSTLEVFTEENQENVFIDEENIDTKNQTIDEYFLKNKFEIINNISESGILWVITDKEKEEIIENVVKNYGARYSFEKRGAVATANKPAFRINLK